MCGIVGIFGHHHVAQEIYDGLITLQHRGQDSAGIVTYNDHFHTIKDNGLVREVFTQENMSKLLGNIGIGHVRYPTAGTYDALEAQPFFVNAPFGISLVHNGNLTNYEALKTQLITKESRHLNTHSDSEALLNILAASFQRLGKSVLTPSDVFLAVKNTMTRLCGSYSVLALIGGQGLLAFRDPTANRPLVLGVKMSSRGEEFMFSSETVALDINGFKVVRDVQPGEAIFIDVKGKLHAQFCLQGKCTPCIFEFVYLARPDSVIDKISVYKTRLRLGKKLVKQIKKSGIKIDVVIPVPDTSRSAALSLAHELKIKYREGLIKNRYIGRTFIMPNQAVRKKSIRFKLNPIILEIKGKNILLVDDSIVRGNTSRQIIELVRQAGAKKVYFASTSPPLRYPCVYGIDMPSKKGFVAHKLTIGEICRVIGADKLFYQTLDDLVDAAREGNPKIEGFCTACFSGKYPTPEVTEEFLKHTERTRGQCARTKEENDGFELEKHVSREQLSLL